MKKIVLNLILSVAGVVLVSAALTYTPPLVHIRNYLQRGDVGIMDFEKHPTRQVLASSRPEPWPLDSLYNKATIAQPLIDSLEKYETTAFLVFQNGKLKYERYWENATPQTRSQSFSAAKSVISMLVGIAIGEGRLKSIDEPVASYIDSFREGEKAKITLRHCLTMSSGLDWHEGDMGVFSNSAYGYYGEDIAKVIDELNVEKPCGKEFEYRSGDTQILALILEKVYRKKIADLTSEKIFQQIGSETNAVWMLDKEDGREKSFCCLAPTARDYARFGHLMLWKGQWKGRQIVPANYMEEALRPATYLLNPHTQKPLQSYGYQFWMQPFRDSINTMSMRGLRGQLIWAIPTKNAVVVRLGHQETPHQKGVFFRPETYYFLEAAMQVLNEKKVI